MKIRGTLFVAVLLVLSIAIVGCGKLDQSEFEMWKNEHVAQVEQSTSEIKADITKLEGKVDQNNKDNMEAISKAKDEAIATSQQGDADTIAAANQTIKEESAKLRADHTKDLDMAGKKANDFAKAEDAKIQKDLSDLAKMVNTQGMDIKKALSQIASMMEELGIVKAEIASKPTLLVTVNFSSGQTRLSAKAKEMIDGVVGQIMENPDAEILVVGHADGTPVLRGGYQSNWDLSQARANAAATYLKDKGVDAARVKSVGRAHTDPVAPQNTSAGRAMNRRVEIILNPTGSM